jgi:hypothetical protein
MKSLNGRGQVVPQVESMFVFVPRLGGGEVAVKAATFKKAKKRVRAPWLGWSQIWVCAANGQRLRIG